MTSKPRNRIVVFRLSQEEYRSLQEACNRAGGRNLSDFTRTKVLERLNSVPLEEQIAAIQFQLNHLLQGAFHEEIKQQS